MKKSLPVLLALASLGVVPALAVTCPVVAAPQVAFDAPRYIDTARAGGEPVSVVARDGAILVSAHAGSTHLYKAPGAAAGAGDFAVGYTNQTLNWRSTDDGQTWTYVGLAGAPVGPHTATSTGFSDPDFAIDQDGRIYNTEIDLGNVAVYSSTDDGQSFAFGHPQVTPGDRPWLAALEKDEVFLVVNAFVGEMLWRSTDGGLTWLLVRDDSPIAGKMHPDPLNPDDGLIAPARGDSVVISADDGRTWQNIGGPDLGASTAFFPAVAADTAGSIYMASAGGYAAANDVTPDGDVRFGWFDREAATWGSTQIPIPAGDALWPWVIAGDNGRAAVVWYQNHAGDPTSFSIYTAVTHNARGTTVTCSDGSTLWRPPSFSVVNASGRPIHVGSICLSGTSCNLNTNSVQADRRLGDFLTVNFDADGDLFIVSGDTMLRAPGGGPKPVANPIFIGQSSGDRMLVAPRDRHPTRCLTPLPIC